MKIIIFELEDWEREAFSDLGKKHNLTLTRNAVGNQTEASFKDADIISTSLASNLSAESLSHFSSLKLIATRTTGFDHIDLNYCQQCGIMVSNVPHYADRTVAEHTFALLLAISHKIPESTNRTRAGNFSLQGLQGFDLEGKVLGVIGTGAIGRQVIEIAAGFRMGIIAFDIQPDEHFAIRFGFRYADMNELLEKSDIITLHVPSNSKTANLLSKPQFAKMKKGAILINTSRGNVINMEAFLEALADGTVAAAGLDVLPEEPVIHEEAELLRTLFTRHYNLEMLLADHVLSRLPNVIITPHSAFNTREAVERLLDTTCRNIKAFIDGKPQNLVTKPQRMPVCGSRLTTPELTGRVRP